MNSNLRRLLPMYSIIVIWTIAWTASVNGPVMPLYVESLGVGIVGWGLLAASAAVGMFLLEWIWGALYDRFDLRLLMICSVVPTSVLFSLYTIQWLVPYFIILQFLTGAVGVALGPTTRAFVSNESPGKSAGLFASLWWAFFILGRTIGPLLGTFIAQLWSFQYSFYASSFLSLVTALLILIALPRKPRRLRVKSPRSLVSGLGSILRVRSLGLLFMTALFAFMGVSLIRSFLPLYASEQFQMSTLNVGFLIGGTSAAQLIALPIFGWSSDKFGRKRTVLLGFSFAAVMFLLFFFVNSQFQIVLASLGASIGLSASSLLLLALVPDISSKRIYGSVVGVFGSFEDVGLIVGPVVFGLIWSAYTPILIFAAAAITQVAGACFLMPIRLGQRRER